jgi:hypothetical protein
MRLLTPIAGVSAPANTIRRHICVYSQAIHKRKRLRWTGVAIGRLLHAVSLLPKRPLRPRAHAMIVVRIGQILTGA